MVQAGSHNFFVAVDGSESSFTAFEMCKDGLMKAGDCIKVGHVSNSAKQKLAFHMRPRSIQTRYTGELMRMEQPEANYVSEDVGTALCTKDKMMEVVSSSEASMLVVGYHGRKGPKQDPTVLGSTVSLLGVNSACPVTIVKVRNTRSNKPNGAFRWAVCFDGAPSSFQGFDMVLKTMDRERDFLEVVTVQISNMDLPKIEEEVAAYLKQHNIKGRHSVL